MDCKKALAGVQQHIVIPVAVVDGVDVPDEQARSVLEVLCQARGHVHHVVRFLQANIEAGLIVAPLQQVVMFRLVSRVPREAHRIPVIGASALSGAGITGL